MEIKNTQDLITAIKELQLRLLEFDGEEMEEVGELIDSMVEISQQKEIQSLQSQIATLTAKWDELFKIYTETCIKHGVAIEFRDRKINELKSKLEKQVDSRYRGSV